MVKQIENLNNQNFNSWNFRFGSLQIILPLNIGHWSLRKSEGFSLLELLLVVVILAVIAALSVPSFSGAYSQVLIKKTVDDLAFAMRYAQAQAVTKQKYYQLQFDEPNVNYWLTRADSEEKENFERISGKMGKTFTIADGIIARPENPTVAFLPSGDIQKTQIQLEGKSQTFVVSTMDQKNHVLVYVLDEDRENLQ